MTIQSNTQLCWNLTNSKKKHFHLNTGSQYGIGDIWWISYFLLVTLWPTWHPQSIVPGHSNLLLLCLICFTWLKLCMPPIAPTLLVFSYSRIITCKLHWALAINWLYYPHRNKKKLQSMALLTWFSISAKYIICVCNMWTKAYRYSNSPEKWNELA